MQLVRYHNDFNIINLSVFTEKELNALFTIMFFLKNKENEKVEVSFLEFKKIACLDSSNKKLKQSILNLSRKMILLSQETVYENGDIQLTSVFDVIRINQEKETVVFSINLEYRYILNDLVEKFTKFDLKMMCVLKNKYSKHVFRFLKQYDHEKTKTTNRFWKIKVEDFRDKLGVPESYKSTDFSKLLNRIELDLKEYFSELKVLRLNVLGAEIGRGEKIRYLKFTWVTEKSLDKVVNKTLNKAKKEGRIVKKKERKNIEVNVKEEIKEKKDFDKEQAKRSIVKRYMSNLGKEYLSLEEISELKYILRLSRISDNIDFDIIDKKYYLKY